MSQATHYLTVKLTDEEFTHVQLVRERLQLHLAGSDSSYQITNHDVFMEALTRLERRLDKLEKKAKKGTKAHAKRSAVRSTTSDRD